MTAESTITNASRKLTCLVADTPETRRSVFRLRHECYLRGGSIEPKPEAEFADAFDQMPNHFSFLVREAGREPLATVRISVVRPDLRWTESPAIHVFGDTDCMQAIASEAYVEASRLCFGQQARRDVFMQLLGNMAALAEHYSVGWLVACPRVEHVGVYQRMFGFRPLAPARKYFGVNFKTQLLGVRRAEHQEHVKNSKPMQDAWLQAYELFKRSSAAVRTAKHGESSSGQSGDIFATGIVAAH